MSAKGPYSNLEFLQQELDDSLIKAAILGDTEEVICLIEKGASPRAKDGQAIMKAAFNGHSQVIKQLIRDDDTLANIRNSFALYLAAFNHHQDVVMLFLRNKNVIEYNKF